MSTVYGDITTRDGKKIAVDAYGVARNIKLVIDEDYVGALTITSAKEVRDLIAFLELAIRHVWGEDELP